MGGPSQGVRPWADTSPGRGAPPKWSETEPPTECPPRGPATPERTPGLCELPEKAGSHSRSSSARASPTPQACVRSVHTWGPSHTASLCPGQAPGRTDDHGCVQAHAARIQASLRLAECPAPSLGTSCRLQRDPTLHGEDAHLSLLVHIVLVGRPGIHVGDGVEQQLRYLDALLPREGSCDVERGQGPQLQGKHRRVRVQPRLPRSDSHQPESGALCEQGPWGPGPGRERGHLPPPPRPPASGSQGTTYSSSGTLGTRGPPTVDHKHSTQAQPSALIHKRLSSARVTDRNTGPGGPASY